MKAYTCLRFGGPEVLRLVDLAKPTPKAGEVLIRIHATSVTSADRRVRAFDVPAGLGLIAHIAFDFKRPRQPILGTELAGVVEAVGSRVSRFSVGDEVFAFPGGKMGCHAEYRCIAEDGPVARKPASLSFLEAASLSFGGCTALHFLRKAKISPNCAILIIGASGGVGTALVQLAKHERALITAVTSTTNLDLVRSLGAEIVIDYTKEDFTKRNCQYDIIVDVVGATTFRACKHLLAKSGRYIAVAGGIAEMLSTIWVPLFTQKKMIAGPAEERAEDVMRIAELAANGVLQPVIDRIYPAEKMADSHRYVDTGRKKGTVLIAVDT